MKGYEKLDDVLARAFKQASQGKGKERHANDLPFHEQPMQQVANQVGRGFLLGQAIKKLVESQGLPPEQAVAEQLGAICYIAGSIIHLEAANDNQPQPDINFEPIMKHETFEYLDHNFQLVEVEGSAAISSDWLRVPEGAEVLFGSDVRKLRFAKRDLIDGGWYSFDTMVKGDWHKEPSLKELPNSLYGVYWRREANPLLPESARERAREMLAKMQRGEMLNIFGHMISFNHQGLYVENYFYSDNIEEILDHLFQEKS